MKPASQVSKKPASHLCDLMDDLPEGSFSLKLGSLATRIVDRSWCTTQQSDCIPSTTVFHTHAVPHTEEAKGQVKSKSSVSGSTGPEVAERLPCHSTQTKKFTHLETIIPGHDPSSSSASLSAHLDFVPSELAPTISQYLDRIPCLAEAATSRSENPEVSLLGIVGAVKELFTAEPLNCLDDSETSRPLGTASISHVVSAPVEHILSLTSTCEVLVVSASLLFVCRYSYRCCCAQTAL